MTGPSCNSLVDEYIRWLRARISVEELNGVCEITTPFLDRHNDHLQIYVKLLDDSRLLLTDDGYTIRDLRMSGLDIGTTRRQSLLQATVNGFGVQRRGDALEVDATRGTFPHKKHSLIQAMLAVNDLFVTAQPYVAELFHEDVERFLAMHQVRFTPNIKFTGKSGFDHRFDFVIPPSANRPERAIRAINNPNRDQATSLIFAWSDTRDVRPKDARVIAVLNDSDKPVPDDVLVAFGQYSVAAVRWTQRDEHAQDFAG